MSDSDKHNPDTSAGNGALLLSHACDPNDRCWVEVHHNFIGVAVDSLAGHLKLQPYYDD